MVRILIGGLVLGLLGAVIGADMWLAVAAVLVTGGGIFAYSVGTIVCGGVAMLRGRDVGTPW